MSRLDEIQQRLDARMREIERKIGRATGEEGESGGPGAAKGAAPAPGAAKGMDGPPCQRIGVAAGLTGVDPACYGGSDGACPGCDVDATDFANVLRAAGFETSLLLNQDAGWDGLSRRIAAAAAQLGPGDLFVLMVSGHGGRGVFRNPQTNREEVHETWCLWDGQVLDDEIVRAFAQFAAGVRIVVVNDQCHAGGVFGGKGPAVRGAGGLKPVLPGPDGEEAWKKAIGFRDPGQLFGAVKTPPMLIQFASCRAEQTSIGMPLGGTWVTALLKVLAATHELSWREWFDRASEHMTLGQNQTPQWVELGPVTDAFRRGKALV